jgi:tRNA wybutosine-synthesizing protein 3
MTFTNEKKPKLFSMSKNLKLNNFWHEKNQFFSKPDKSSAGGIDKDILQLVRKINSKPDYYTTSSCSGRIILMKETGKKQESVFLFISHSKVSLAQLKAALAKAIKSYKKMIYLKIEPCIMHIACKDFDSAIKLTNLARNSGWKKAGIISKRNIIEAVSTENLAAPVADKGKIIIENNYLQILLKECNIKLSQTRQKIRRLYKALWI